MAVNLPIRLSLQDQNKVRQGLRALGKDGQASLKRFEQATRGPNKGLLALDSAVKDVSGSVQGLAGRLGPLGAGLRALGPAGTAAAAALAGLGGGLAILRRAGDEFAVIGDTADGLNVTAESLQSLTFAAGETGASFAAMQDALAELNNAIGETLRGETNAASRALQELEIDLRDANDEVRSTDDVFRDFVRRLEGVESGAERAALANAVLGEEAGRKLAVLLSRGEAGLAGLERQARDLGQVMREDLVREAQEVSREFARLTDRINIQFKGAVLSVANAVRDLRSESRPDFLFGDALERSREQAVALQAELEALEGRVGRAPGRRRAKLRGRLAALEGQDAPLQLERTLEQIAEFEQQIADIEGTRRRGGQGSRRGNRIQTLRGEIEEATAKAEELSRIIAEAERPSPAANDNLRNLEQQSRAREDLIESLAREREQQAALAQTVVESAIARAAADAQLARAVEETSRGLEEGIVSARDLAGAFGGLARDGLRDFDNLEGAVLSFRDRLLDLATDPVFDAIGRQLEGLFAGVTGGDLFGGLFQGLFGGGSAGAPAPAGPSFINGFGPGLSFHEGGVVGRDGTPRAIPTAALMTAPRLHRGGMIASDEVPAILQTGERVLSRREAAAYDQPAPVVVHVHNETGRPVQAEARRESNGDIRIFLRDALTTEIRNGAFDRAFAARYGTRPLLSGR